MQSVAIIFVLVMIGILVADGAGKFYPYSDLAASTSKGGTAHRVGRYIALAESKDQVQTPTKFIEYIDVTNLKGLLTIGMTGGLAVVVARRLGVEKWVATIMSQITAPVGKGKRESDQKYEELWLAIREMQDSRRAADGMVIKLQEELQALRDALTKGVAEQSATCQEIQQAVEQVEKEAASTAELLRMEAHGSLRELEHSLTQLEDRVEQEARALAAGVAQLREELPQRLAQHDATIGRRLEKFKEDLRKLIGKASGASAQGQPGSLGKAPAVTADKRS